MNTTEASIKWNCSKQTVSNYCNDGLIPNVYKENNKWIIPDECIKPPFTKQRLLIFLDNLVQIKHGADLSILNYGNTKKDIIKALQYLSNLGFITNYNINLKIAENIKNLNITPRGKTFIENSLKSLNLKGKLTINLGFLTAEISK